MELFFKDNVKIEITKSSLCGIYFFFKNDIIVYIGQSINVESRVVAHTKNKEFDSWNYIKVDSIDLNEVESTYILEYQPKYNKTIPFNKKWISKNNIKNKHNIFRNVFNESAENNEFKSLVFLLGNSYILISEFNEWKKGL